MSPAPPAWLVKLMDRLIPPPSREAVLGDLWEEYRSPDQFLRQGLAVLPFLVFSQVRRRSSWPILGLQAFILFACLRGFLPVQTIPAPWMRAALPTLFAFLALAWHDTYRSWQDEPAPRSAWGEVAAVIFGIGLSQLVTAMIVALTGLSTSWLLTWPELLFAASALPVLCLLRWGAAAPNIGRTGDDVDLPGNYERFRSSVRWRNRLEIGAMAVTLLISGMILSRVDGPVSLVVWLTLLGFVFLLAYLVQRGGAPAPRPAASRDEMRRLFCKELVRQHKLRSILVWWWLTPLLIGLAMHFLLATGPETLQARQVIGILLILALGACIHGFNAERAEIVHRNVRALSAALPSNERLR
jgi:hypothetical protein